MRIRLSHILLAMTAILLAGLATVTFFERNQGGAGVPGVVLLSQPEFDEAALRALAEAIPGARVELVAAGSDPLAPFDGMALSFHLTQGYETVLLAPGGPLPPEAGWEIRALQYPVLANKDAFEHAIDDVLFEIRRHPAERPYLIGVLADPLSAERVTHFVDQCLDVFSKLDSYRRHSVVVLGAHSEQGAQRFALRVDRGRWGRRAQSKLADLLEPHW